jgi:hypothetical protein
VRHYVYLITPVPVVEVVSRDEDPRRTLDRRRSLRDLFRKTLILAAALRPAYPASLGAADPRFHAQLVRGYGESWSRVSHRVNLRRMAQCFQAKEPRRHPLRHDAADKNRTTIPRVTYV